MGGAKVVANGWDEFPVAKWQRAILAQDGFFHDLYRDTIAFVRDIADGKSNVRVIEVGSGTGDFLLPLAKYVQTCVGVDLNQDFVRYTREQAEQKRISNVEFHEGNAIELEKVLADYRAGPKDDEFVIIACVNNTFGIMPSSVRKKVYEQMIKVSKKCKGGSALVCTYWDGDCFGDGLQHFYGRNQELCGSLKDADIDWERKTLRTKSGYYTEWMTASQAYDIVNELNLILKRLERRSNGVLVHAEPSTISNDVDESKERELNYDTEEEARDYYDSEDAFNFYTQIWGGDNIHIGNYLESYETFKKASKGVVSGVERVREASSRSLQHLCDKLNGITRFSKVMDMGSALGGASRYIANRFGAQVVGVDLSRKECEVNEKEVYRAGLTHLIKVKCCSFTDTCETSNTFDYIISEDSFLHAGKYRADTVKEAARLLKPGGYMVFTDIMEADGADKKALEPIYNRIHLQDMGSPEFYKRVAKQNGLKFVEFEEMTDQLVEHYFSIREVLNNEGQRLKEEFGVSENYIANMKTGLGHWVNGGQAGTLVYGLFVFQKAA